MNWCVQIKLIIGELQYRQFLSKQNQLLLIFKLAILFAQQVTVKCDVMVEWAASYGLMLPIWTTYIICHLHNISMRISNSYQITDFVMLSSLVGFLCKQLLNMAANLIQHHGYCRSVCKCMLQIERPKQQNGALETCFWLFCEGWKKTDDGLSNIKIDKCWLNHNCDHNRYLTSIFIMSGPQKLSHATQPASWRNGQPIIIIVTRKIKRKNSPAIEFTVIIPPSNPTVSLFHLQIYCDWCGFVCWIIGSSQKLPIKYLDNNYKALNEWKRIDCPKISQYQAVGSGRGWRCSKKALLSANTSNRYCWEGDRKLQQSRRTSIERYASLLRHTSIRAYMRSFSMMLLKSMLPKRTNRDLPI